MIVEAKRFRANLAVAKTLTQTLMYAFLNGVEWCILTNGRHAVVYDASSREPVRERALFGMIDLAVTHYGKVESIKPWRNSGKYVVKLRGAAKEIPAVPIDKHSDPRRVAPRRPRFTTIDALLSAKTLNECWFK